MIAIDAVTELQKLGWTEQEAKIYVTLIANSESLTGYQVEKLAHIARANVYPMLDRLVRRGAVTQEPQFSGLRYRAVPFRLVSQTELATVTQTLSTIAENLPQVHTQNRLITARGKRILETHVNGLALAAKDRLDFGASYNTVPLPNP